MGMLAIRRQGIYFSMITLALAQMVYFALLRVPFTHGEDGLQGVPRGKLLGVIDLSNDTTLYFVVLAICIAGFALIVRTVHSPFGQVLKAIKENEPRAISLGYDVDKYKLMAFVLSAGLAGLAGATKTLVLGFETLTDVHWSMSGLVILMTLVGGMGTLVGPILGAFIVITLENKLGDLGTFLARSTGVEWFSTLGESVGMVIGLIFIACVLLFRRGIVGEIGAAIAAAAASRSRPELAASPECRADARHFLWDNDMMVATIHILAGSTGAGKSTYAAELCARTGAVRFSIDEWMGKLFWMDSPHPIRPKDARGSIVPGAISSPWCATCPTPASRSC